MSAVISGVTFARAGGIGGRAGQATATGCTRAAHPVSKPSSKIVPAGSSRSRSLVMGDLDIPGMVGILLFLFTGMLFGLQGHLGDLGQVPGMCGPLVGKLHPGPS